jgi:Leucine-rich repeat (LRR) protein
LGTEIDAFLSGKETVLTTLTLTATPLTSVPTSVCRLSRLQRLDLTNNSLTSLPYHCFTQMKELEWFNASFNQLVELKVTYCLEVMGMSVPKTF